VVSMAIQIWSCVIGGCNSAREYLSTLIRVSTDVAYSFFPFYRNHNTLATIGQEAFRWSSVIAASKTAMAVRFQLLPYLYTLFYNAHTNGETVMRAMAWEFPNDPSLAAADRQFFLGPSILVTPVLDQGATSVNGVFPGLMEGTDVYYDWYNHSQVAMPSTKNTTIQAPLGHIPVYIRGGAVLAMQQPALTTDAARKTGWSILIAPGVDGTASGSVYLDDGESITPNATKTVNLAASLSNGRISLNVTVDGSYTGLDTPLANVTVLGVTQQPRDGQVSVNGRQVAKSMWNSTSESLFVGDLQNTLGGKAWGTGWEMVIG
jgi:alpha-glucosidase